MEHPLLATKADSSPSPRERTRDSSAAFAADPDAHREACRRFSGLALTYVVGYTLFYGYALIMSLLVHEHGPRGAEHVFFGIAVVVGLSGYVLGRDVRIPAPRFADFVVVFQLVTTFAIAGEMWGWEHQLSKELEEMWAALGIPGGVKTKFVDPLLAADIRPLSSRGITGVGIWVMIIPFVVPLSTFRTILASTLSVLIIPAVMFGSLAAHGTPDMLRAWSVPFIMDLTIPTAITAAIGVYGSRTFYRVSRELARMKRMGSYQLVELIGSGGMGEVWRAKHRLLVRPAAIKLIRRDVVGTGEDSHAALSRFEREAQATSALTSPHSVELYDFGVTEDGTFYYVMELLDGLNLRVLVERFGPVPAERAIHFLKQACHSLADAHAQGLIHRDVKPANVLACRRGLDFDFVKVLDFGLVKRQESTQQTAITQDGIASGTPAFMAPEMATGEGRIDGRTDLYALGCVGYWLLTGRLVFEGDTAIQVLLRHVRETPEPPSKRTEIVVPGDLDAIILRLLEKEPSRRFPDARALAAALAECERKIAPWTPERAASWWSVHVPEHRAAV